MKHQVWYGLSLLLVMTMLTGLLACGTDKSQRDSITSNEEKQQADGETKQENENEEEVVEKSWTNDDSAEITILMNGDNTPDDDNIVLKELEKQTGTKINMIYVPVSDYDTKLNAMIAGGTVPDIFYVPLADAVDFQASGLLANVEDVLNAVAPNVIEDVGDVIQMASINTDGIYLVPNGTRTKPTSLILRSDWLENLGLEEPTDLESLADVYHAFTYDDPDGNGEDDTFGYSFNLANLTDGTAFEEIFGAYGIAKDETMVMEDGTVTTWVKHPKFLEAIAYIKGLIDDGVCEPEYVTIPNSSMFEKLWNGTSGAMSWTATGPLNNWLGRYVEEPTPTFCTPIIVGENGQSGVAAQYISCAEGWVFSADCKNLEGAARIANFCMSAEGSDLLYLGVEDVMYKWVDKENGTVEYLNEYADSATQRAAGGYCYWGLFTPSDNAELRTLNKQTREAMDQAWDNAVDWVNLIEVSQVYVEYGADMDQILNEMIAELLATDADKMQSVYDEYMKEWENCGGSDWEAEVTELWNK